MPKDIWQCTCGSYSFYKGTVLFFDINGSIVESDSLFRLECVKCGAKSLLEKVLKDGRWTKKQYGGPEAVARIKEDEKEYRSPAVFA